LYFIYISVVVTSSIFIFALYLRTSFRYGTFIFARNASCLPKTSKVFIYSVAATCWTTIS